MYPMVWAKINQTFRSTPKKSSPSKVAAAKGFRNEYMLL